MKLEFYCPNNEFGNPFELASCGFQWVRLDISGVDFVATHHTCATRTSSNIQRPPRDYRVGLPQEALERCHQFRLAARIGKLLCQM